jgi:hypothetical protein
MSTAPSPNVFVHAATGSIDLRYSYEGNYVEDTTQTDQRWVRHSPTTDRPLCDTRHMKDNQ